MGVPAFYGWLSRKYPMVVAEAVEEELLSDAIGGLKVTVDSPNTLPNNVKYDNLYLDMNGIIHPCFHPEETDDPPTTFEEVFLRIFDVIDKVFRMVRPQKLLYLAIDGVAPRAKMNQQRSRRFRTAKDAAEALVEEERLREEFEREGKHLPPKVETEVKDSNLITPGTKFMSDLSVALEYYIHLRLNYDPAWKNIKVILSDANVPGEGEHKIMSYIRLQRNLPGYDPNTRHCLFGLDADLIMLALATHEVHFSILREEEDKADGNGVAKKTYKFLHVWILREYLHHEITIPDASYEIDLERFIDDFVFMCFFVGNDFLPHMPTLSIYERAIDLLLAVYKKEFKSLGGYLTEGSKPDMKRVSHFIHAVGTYEDRIFRKRAILKQCLERRIMREMAEEASRNEDEEYSQDFDDSNSVLPVPRGCVRPCGAWQSSSGSTSGVAAGGVGISCESQELENEKELKKKLKEVSRQKSDLFRSKTRPQDKVRLGEPGWKERYYALKFSAGTPQEMQATRKDVAYRYAEGLFWVMKYYYEGVCSWKWFYPYHYAPFASDLGDLGKLKIKLERGTPFKPFDQLLAVLPAASDAALPTAYRTLMTDPSSPIISFYPSDFEVDMDGKRYTGQGVAKLPFIDEPSLRREVAKIEHTLSDEERLRNSVMFDKLFVSTSHPLAQFITSIDIQKSGGGEKINPELSDGINGYLAPCNDGMKVLRSPVQGMRDISANEVVCAEYRLPDAHEHITRPPLGVVFPEQTVEVSDLNLEPVLWHEDSRRQNLVQRNRYDRNVDVPSMENNQTPSYVPPPARRFNRDHGIQDQRRQGMAFRPASGNQAQGPRPRPPLGRGYGGRYNDTRCPQYPRSHHNYQQQQQQQRWDDNNQRSWRQNDR